MVDSPTGLSLDRALEDLHTIVSAIRDQGSGGVTSYSAAQKSLPKLNLHVLTYVRFLENHGYVEYDRVKDTIRVTDAALHAINDDSMWRDQARGALAQHLTPSTAASPLDFDVDNILSGIGDLDLDDGNTGEISFPGGNAEIDFLPSNYSSTDDDPVTPAEIDFDAPSDNTGPEIATPDFDSQPPHVTPTMTQDPLRERRFATGTHGALSDNSNHPELFERLEEIGSGGMGTVFKARQVKLDRVVALKEIKEIFDVFAGVQRSDIIARFTEIIQTQSKLIHPNIIQTIDLDTDAKFPFVIMQLAPNGNLRRLINMPGRPSLQVSLKYFLQILHALSSAHDMGVTHGGIKPENVVLDSAGNALLTDFGISQVVELDGTRANQVYVGVGTVAYMSPEQFKDPNASSVKSDIYSLGIMLYEMLTGKVPGRRSPMPSSFYPDIPRKLDDIFDRMSMDDQDDRYNSIDEILADIYSSKEVMKILDKRGGFVFLRDPMEFGATGLKIEVAIEEEDDEELSVPSGEQHGLGEESSSDLEEDSSEAEEDSEASSDDDDGDVLSKLDKYGKEFGDD
jgi:serine/threonine protein kinase